MKSNKIAALAVLVLLTSAMVMAQGPRRDAGNNVPLPPVPAADAVKDPISIDVDLVSVDVVVADKNGALIKGLEKKDFKIYDDNVEQRITHFSPTEAPLTVVVMFEFSATFGYYYDDAIRPAAGFINSLTEDDWAALVVFDLKPQIITDFTKNKNLLFAGLSGLRFPTYRETVLFDAVYDTLDRLEKIDGKKAIFLLSTGLDTISRHTFSEALRKAETSDTMIYAVSLGQFARLYFERNLSQLDNITLLSADNYMRSLAEATGGQAFYPRFPNEYMDIFDNVGKQLRNQYSLGFTSTNTKKDGKFRKLRVEIPDLDLNKDGKADGLKARHRKGYYAPKS
jgi:VWFA-related protein